MATRKKFPDLLILQGTPQHYAWGGTAFIASLFGFENAAQKPIAEMWIGAHPKSPTIAHFDSETQPLDRLIDSHAAEFLGIEAADAFKNRLPFLLKVLDVRQMLSIQVHPTKAQAQAGFARENKLGVPLTAGQRNYKDDNHKPEVHIALSDFWMLHGFRPLPEIAALLTGDAPLQMLASEFAPQLRQVEAGAMPESDFMKALYTRIMTMPQSQVEAMLRPTIEALLPRYQRGDLIKTSPDFWAARAALQFKPASGAFDRGIFSIYLLNLISLKPGQATFQDAGILHAYLEGQTVELMANSDNVLRGGLTPKHIDIPELLKVVHFRCGAPQVLSGVVTANHEQIYPTPAKDFQLSKISLPRPESYEHSSSEGMAVFLVTAGRVAVRHAQGEQFFTKGQIFLVCAHTHQILTAENDATLYRAAIPK